MRVQNPLGGLPPNWEEAKTEDGEIYYYNAVTGETTWERPSGPPAPPSRPPAPNASGMPSSSIPAIPSVPVAQNIQFISGTGPQAAPPLPPEPSWFQRKIWRSEYRFVFIYFCFQIGFFAFGYIRFMHLKKILKWIPLARGCGMLLNFNCAFILAPVLRNLIMWLRLTPIADFIPLDHHIEFHKLVGKVIFVAGMVHTLSHYMNYSYVSTVEQINEQMCRIGTEVLPAEDCAWCPAEGAGPFQCGKPLGWNGWATRAGFTGHVITIVMFVMYFFAWEKMRRRGRDWKDPSQKPWFGGFDQFWYTHHLYIVFFICLLFHGPVFYIWFFWPCLFFIVEKLVQQSRISKDTEILTVQHLKPDVIFLKMKKKTFTYRPGQYLRLNCPALSAFEWHPFTISSAPHEEYVTVHIRCVGKWTKALREFLDPKWKERGHEPIKYGKARIPTGKGGKTMAIIQMDGPYGAPAEHIFEYPVAILIAAGVGVTPFASILKHIKHKLSLYRTLQDQNVRDPSMKLHKVYFYWTTRDKESFEWLTDILYDLASPEVLIHMYWTGASKLAQRPEDVAKIMEKQYKSGEEGRRIDAITGLEIRDNVKVEFSRPNWKVIFGDIAKEHAGNQIGVFLCGPPVLADEVGVQCKAYTTPDAQEDDPNATRFIFRKEYF